MDGVTHNIGKWDLLIAHPPCTYLTKAGGNRLVIDGKIQAERYKKGCDARDFFMKFWDAPVEKIAIENPIPMRIFGLPEYSQIIQPYMFGDEYMKTTCLWLKKLPILFATDIVIPTSKWVSSSDHRAVKRKDAWSQSGHRTAKQRSKTFPGIAKAMAEQWGGGGYLMKAIILSIRPNWCKLIWGGMKTMEVRKTRPKLETPFKVYIYCTGSDDWYMKLPKSGMKKMNGKVIGEFTCDSVERLTHIDKPSRLSIVTSDLYYKPADELLRAACLTEAQAEKYLKGGDGYGWHISKLKIWDEPVKLKDFWGIQPCNGKCRTCRRMDVKTGECKGEHLGIDRPPQSWYYVEVAD